MTENDANPTLDKIIAQYLELTQSGRQPDRHQYIERYPDLAADLNSFFASHDQLKRSANFDSQTLPLGKSTEFETLAPLNNSALQFTRVLRNVPADDATLPLGNTTSPLGSEVGSKAMYFGDYELVEEIARGGMGVVYKARQVSLNRTVALKMILAGQLAGPEDVQRFHAEAEAAANLDHPGIVPIHEVGEHAGQHFFSMAFVEGSSLADTTAAGPILPRRAATYVKKVAEAMAYAHARGVIHRDLKPANVLLDRHDEPKVTDFGLAKRVETDSGLTASGQILGTPSYMPPEQASGRIVSETADVYSLGAILYSLITGRAPFGADSYLDTLIQVLERDPTPPRLLNRAVPQELALICLRCLEKNPTERYPSAAALAEDLERFLVGEPIVARTSSMLHRLVRWARRKPALASRFAGLAVIALIILILYVFIGTTGGFVTQALGVLLGWGILSALFQRLVAVEPLAEMARLAWVGAEPCLLTILLFLTAVNHEPPIGPVLVGYPLLVTAAGLFSRVRLVFFVTGVSVLSYLVLLFLQPEEAEPFYFPIYFITTLIVVGCIVGYQVRRLNLLSRYYEDKRG